MTNQKLNKESRLQLALYFRFLLKIQFIHKQINLSIVSLNLVAGCDILESICH